MRYYAVLSKMTQDGRRAVKDLPETFEQINKAVEASGGGDVKIITQFALLGPYDFLTILQAKDNKVMLRAAMELESGGLLDTMTVPAVPMEEYVAEFKKLNP